MDKKQIGYLLFGVSAGALVAGTLIAFGDELLALAQTPEIAQALKDAAAKLQTK